MLDTPVFPHYSILLPYLHSKLLEVYVAMDIFSVTTIAWILALGLLGYMIATMFGDNK
tara:strand:+ start:450 stop:623 length:174 start_codon:yes stop_codon:yes gene_type:complete